MEKIEELVNTFNIKLYNKESKENLNLLAQEIQIETMRSYSKNTPFITRRHIFSEFELKKWNRLSYYIKPSKKICLFDTGFGSGRDLLLAKSYGYSVYGCELSKYMYEDFITTNEIQKSHLICCDMRTIPFPNERFDIVRHNASFLHMPMIGKGYTIHSCLDESYRLLKKNGILYIFIKEGNGFITLDTLDGLGKRPFQLFSEELLKKVLQECNFKTLEINHYERNRNGQIIYWIEVYAKKNWKF